MSTLPSEQLLHGADKNNVQPRKEPFSKRKVQTRKSDGNDSSNNSLETSDSNVNILPPFSPSREPGIHLPSIVTRQSFKWSVDFFSLFFTNDTLKSICDHANAYTWREIMNKQSYCKNDGSWKEVTPEEIKKLKFYFYVHMSGTGV